MRLVLDEQGITTNDLEAKCLNHTLSNYRKVRDYFLNVPLGELKLSDLTHAHGYLSPGDPKYGSFRDFQTWFGKDRKNPVYVAPEKKEMFELLSVWLNKVNNEPTTIDSILYAYANLLIIHPFRDGNGRFARAFLNSHLSRLMPEQPSVSLYRLGRNDAYVDSINTMKWGQQNCNHLPGYWQDAFSWCNSLNKKVTEKWKVTKNQIYSCFLLTTVEKEDNLVISYLLDKPAFQPTRLQAELNVAPNKLAKTIKKLHEFGIVKAGIYENDYENQFFYSQLIFETLNEIEDYFFC